MRPVLIALATLALVGTAVAADPVEERQAIMKANGKALSIVAPMVKGEKDFDATAAIEALTALRDQAATLSFEKHWPEGSTGGDSESSPKIWEDKAGFQAALDKFKADTQAAVDAAPKDLDALKVSFGAVASNCGGCHKAYRISK